MAQPAPVQQVGGGERNVLGAGQPAPVHSFNPDATPQQKAAAAGAGRDKLTSVKRKDTAIAKELAVDVPPPSPPAITISFADDEPKPKTQKSPPTSPKTPKSPKEPMSPTSLKSPVSPTTSIPGSMPEEGTPYAIPDWYKVGWREVSGVDEQPKTQDEKDKLILTNFVDEQFYGEWYHNAAIIIFAVFASHFLTLFRFGWGWLYMVLSICCTWYNTSMWRFRRAARDDIQRELTKTRLVNEHETADWINNFLDRFWLIYEPVLSSTIVSSVDQVLSTSTPAFLDSIRLTTFTLGRKAPRIEKVRTFPRTEDDVVVMDWGLSFTPKDITARVPMVRGNKNENPKIVLEIRVGRGIASAGIPILVEDMSFSGVMRIKMKLMTNFPHVQVVDISFTEKPIFDFVLKPIGGETFGFDIANIPGLSPFIRDTVHGILGPMMYDPNVFTLNLEQLLSGEPIDAAIGVLQVTVHTARSLKGTKVGGGQPDPYVALSISNREELARTKVVNNTYNPTWNETKFILIKSLQDVLCLTVFDWNEVRKDHELGAASFDLSKLLEDATHEDLTQQVLRDGKERGELRFDVSYFPVIKPLKVDGKEEELPDSKVGIVRVTVHQAKELDSTKSISGDLNPLVKVYLKEGDDPIFKTRQCRHTNNPVWEAATEFLCSDKEHSTLTFNVVDDRDFLKDPIVGHKTLKLSEILENMKEAGRNWWTLNNCRTGKIRISAEWRPLNMAGSLHGASEYVPPIGIVRLCLQRAIDLKNVEAALGGKSDPYVRVVVKNTTLGRTEVVNNNLNPEWDQFIYIPVHSLKETMILECMDYQHLTKDRSLGSTELKVSSLARAETGDSKYRYAASGKQTHADRLRLDSGNVFKGTLHFTAEFVPALALKTVSFDSQPNEIERAVLEEGVDATEAKETANGKKPDAVEAEGKARTSEETTHTTGTQGTNKTGQSPNSKETEFKGLELTKEELLQHQAGIIVFNVLGGRLSQKARLEVLLDNGYWPAFATVKSRSTNAQWDYVGEGFVKELDFGRIWLRLNLSEDGEKDNIIGEFKTEARSFLEAALDAPVTYTLSDQDGRRTSTVELEARYVPVDIKLEPRESINNQGLLHVILQDGQGIRGVDRSGKSDPFVVFTLNGQKVFKSQTKKKTVNPSWNEDFTISVPSRVGAKFDLEVFDWNQIEQAKSIGSAELDLSKLEPFQGVELTVPLEHDKHGDSGSVRLSLNFQPEIIVKQRKNTSTFSTAGRAVTQIGTIPFGAGRGVVHGVTNVFKRDHAKEDGLPPLEAVESARQISGGSAGVANGNGAAASKFVDGNFPSEPGVLKVTVVGAMGLPGGDLKLYTVVRVGDREQKTSKSSKTSTPEWNETLQFIAGPHIQKMSFQIVVNHTIGKDKLLVEGEVDIWKHVQAAGRPFNTVVDLPNNTGQIQLQLEFEEGIAAGRASSSTHSIDRPFGSPSRFTLRRKAEEDK